MNFLRPVHGTTQEVVAALERWLAATREPEPLVVATSGSTGRPKQVLLSRRAMLASAEATHQRLGAPGRWLLALPISYVAGLQVAIRSLLAGAAPIEVDDDWAAAVERLDGVGYASLVPTQLHRIVTDGGAALAALARLDAVLLGGGPIDPALRARAEAAGVRVVATYGASETSGGCVYDGVALPGVEVRIDEAGLIRLGGATVFSGYLDDPELTAATLHDGWYLTSDLGRIVDGRLQVLGRADDVVISGGVNVPLPAVAARLREHPDVELVEVVGVLDPEWGQRVVAVVTGARLPELAVLRDWVAETSPRAWAPRDVVAVAQLPLLSNGKPDRAAIRRLAQEAR
ncbi:AMP-binding protein [Nocardioides dubius]|uniref:O-succinylbenzoate--CoA ligase n=1 Tax=Nocardioides dubius TaxID=317019 RepID=A0ABP4EIW8_9ACTN